MVCVICSLVLSLFLFFSMEDGDSRKPLRCSWFTWHKWVALNRVNVYFSSNHFFQAQHAPSHHQHRQRHLQAHTAIMSINQVLLWTISSPLTSSHGGAVDYIKTSQRVYKVRMKEWSEIEWNSPMITIVAQSNLMLIVTKYCWKF